MNRRRTPLHERVHGVPQAPAPLPAPVKRCWVLDEYGGQPGLLLDWRRTGAGWEGRVARPVRDATSWTVVVEWLGAERLRADP